MSRSPMRTQSHPWHNATKRQIMGAFTNQNSSNDSIDGTNPDHVRLLLEDLKIKFDQIVSNLQADLVDIKLQQEEALNVGLMKLPKNVRQMSVRDFNQAHSCDVLALLKSKDGVVTKPQYPTESKKREYPLMAPAATPAPRQRNVHDPPMSELRTVRKGEGLFSINGSPVETHEAGSMVATVTKKRRGNEGANFEINVGDGRVINLNDPNGVDALDSSMKATAASQLKVLQDQMATLMAQLMK